MPWTHHVEGTHSKKKLRIPFDEEAGTVSTVLTVGSHNEIPITDCELRKEAFVM